MFKLLLWIVDMTLFQYNPEKEIIEKSKNIRMSPSKQRAEQKYYESITATIVGYAMARRRFVLINIF